MKSNRNLGRGKSHPFDPAEVRWNPRKSKIQRAWRSHCAGLCLQVFAAPGDRRRTGRKSWQLRHDYQGRSRILTIGSYPELELAAAIEMAVRLKKEAKKGRDLREVLASGFSNSPTTLSQFLAIMRKDLRYPLHQLSTSRQRNFNYMVDRYLVPSLGSRPVESIEAEDLLFAVDRLVDEQKYGAAAGLVGMIGTLYRQLRSHPSFRQLKSPLQGLAIQLPKHRPKNRVLDVSELHLLWNHFDHPGRRALPRLLTLSGQRVGNLLSLTWDMIEDDRWLVGSEKQIKSRRAAHWLPMNPQFRLAFESMRGQHSRWVFPGKAGHLGHSAAQFAIKQFVRATGTPHFSPHTLRHSFTSGVLELGCDYIATQRALDHSLQQITETYAHGQFLKQKEAVLLEWEDYLRKTGVISEFREVAITDSVG